MSAPAVEAMRPYLEALFTMFATTVTYEGMDIKMAVRSMKSDELWGSALQGDRLGVVRASEFHNIAVQPKKYAKVVADQSYTVQDWRPSPGTSQAPVWYKLVLRGGSV